MLILQCKNVKKVFGIHEVLKAVSLDLEEGERVGLVGKNGAGKTTLANIIYGSLKPDGGQIIWHRKDVQIGYLRQSVFYTSNLLHELYLEQDAAAQLKDFLHIASELGTEKVYRWEDERFAALSGGEKTKLALAHIWSAKPDLLILDEPTNHLDFQGVQWLIDELKGYPGTILAISHNRYFLDQSVNRILEVENGSVNEYRGNYTFYRNEKRKRYEDQLHAYEVQEKYKEKLNAEIRQLKEWSGKAHRDSTKKGAGSGLKMGLKEFYRAKAKKMDKKVKSTVKRLEKLKTEGVQRPEDEFRVAFSFDEAEKHGRRVLEASNLSKRFGDRVLFGESSFYLQRGEKIGVFGENGCGKTTLVRAILGQEPVDGTLKVSPSANIGYMSQDVHDLDINGTPLDLFDMPNRKEQGRIRTMLANLGFDEVLLTKPLKSLSLGERTKLKLANLITRGYDFLILDEPTNHLELHAREQLEEALEMYEGTILLIAHDRYMLDRICDKMLVFEEGRIRRVEYGLEEYLKRLEQPEAGRTKKSAMSEEEEKMVLENRITTVLGKLSQLKPETPEYVALDAEFKELISRRNKR
jgi:macrolide transport system ATP-binding/permease protein